MGASALQMQLIALDARDAGELEAALLGIEHGTADALMASPDVLFLSEPHG